jgi:hypothetical protein
MTARNGHETVRNGHETKARANDHGDGGADE